VANLPGHALEALEDLPVDDDPSTDARADRDIDEMSDPFRRTEIILPEGRRISVVDQESSFLVLFLNWTFALFRTKAKAFLISALRN